jgi:hypothetical protein
MKSNVFVVDRKNNARKRDSDRLFRQLQHKHAPKQTKQIRTPST